MRFSKILGLALVAIFLALPAAQSQETSVAQDDVLNYLEQLINWQRDAAALQSSTDNAREVILQNSIHQNALHVLQSGFKFARAEANHRTQQTTDDQPREGEAQTPSQRIADRAKQNDSRITQINTRLTQLDTLISASKPTSRTALQKERNDLQDELKLATAKQELYQTVLTNMSSAASSDSKGFSGKINNLARTIPELSAPTTKEAKEIKNAEGPSALALLSPIPLPSATTATPATTPTAANPRPVTSILSLSSDLFDITRKQRELKDFQLETTQLENTSRGLIKTLRVAMDEETDPNAAAPTDADGKPLPAPSIDQKVAEFKKIAADIIPLGDATLWVGVSKRNIEDWKNLLDGQTDKLLRSLLIHLAILAVTLAIPLIISSAVKRAIKRYVPDAKRQRQAQTARRIILGLVIFFILLENFISDFSSFATFAGFLTAGLAVALQSVLLSLVAHFFFYGRYGVRNGDYVNVGGVTGEILQIGMVRLYIREMEKTETGFKPTGKVVAFPNSILFQPSAFYKYV